MSDDTNDTNDANEANDEQAMLPFDDGSMGRLIRQQWHEGRWFFSVVDVIAVLTDSDAPNTYWGMMKQRLAKEEGFTEVFTKCEKLKMRSPLDGKKYPTDAADAETMLRIVQSVPSRAERAQPEGRADQAIAGAGGRKASGGDCCRTF